MRHWVLSHAVKWVQGLLWVLVFAVTWMWILGLTILGFCSNLLFLGLFGSGSNHLWICSHKDLSQHPRGWLGELWLVWTRIQPNPVLLSARSIWFRSDCPPNKNKFIYLKNVSTLLNVSAVLTNRVFSSWTKLMRFWVFCSSSSLGFWLMCKKGEWVIQEQSEHGSDTNSSCLLTLLQFYYHPLFSCFLLDGPFFHFKLTTLYRRETRDWRHRHVFAHGQMSSCHRNTGLCMFVRTLIAPHRNLKPSELNVWSKPGPNLNPQTVLWRCEDETKCPHKQKDMDTHSLQGGGVRREGAALWLVGRSMTSDVVGGP